MSKTGEEQEEAARLGLVFTFLSREGEWIMRRKSPVVKSELDPTLQALLAKPPRSAHQVAYVLAKDGRFARRGVVSAPRHQLDAWEAHPNGVMVEERFGLVGEEPRLVACRGLDSGISLPEAVARAAKKPKKVSARLADLCRAAHQDPEELLRM